QVPLGLHGLRGTVEALTPTVNNLGDSELNCSYLGLLLYNVASIESEGDKGHTGRWVDVASISPPTGPNSEVGPASAPANSTIPASVGDPLSNHLHSNPYPLIGAKGQNRICMAGNEVYVTGQTLIGNPPGLTPRTTARVPRKLNGF